jgi:hypothetical protein
MVDPHQADTYTAADTIQALSEIGQVRLFLERPKNPSRRGLASR